MQTKIRYRLIGGIHWFWLGPLIITWTWSKPKAVKAIDRRAA